MGKVSQLLNLQELAIAPTEADTTTKTTTEATTVVTRNATSTTQNQTSTTTTSPTVRQDFACHLTYMDVFIPAVLVPNSELTLRDPTCKLTNNGTHHKIIFLYNTCGTSESFYTDHIDIQNEISVHSILNKTAVITFVEDYKIPLQCTVDRSTILNSAIEVEPRENIEERLQHSGDFNLREYTTADYNEEITDYPIKVPLNREIFFEITLKNNSNSSIGVLVEHCYATPTPSPNDTTKVDLINSGCPAQSAVKVQPSTGIEQFRFSTQAFHFSAQSSVYIHCSVRTCGGDNCRRTSAGDKFCLLHDRRRRRSARKLGSVTLTSGSHVVTNGSK